MTRTLRFFQNVLDEVQDVVDEVQDVVDEVEDVVDEDFSFIWLLTSYDPKPVVFSRMGFAPIIEPTRAE